jgi:hypothetical protein
MPLCVLVVSDGHAIQGYGAGHVADSVELNRDSGCQTPLVSHIAWTRSIRMPWRTLENSVRVTQPGLLPRRTSRVAAVSVWPLARKRAWKVSRLRNPTGSGTRCGTVMLATLLVADQEAFRPGQGGRGGLPPLDHESEPFARGVVGLDPCLGHVVGVQVAGNVEAPPVVSIPQGDAGGAVIPLSRTLMVGRDQPRARSAGLGDDDLPAGISPRCSYEVSACGAKGHHNDTRGGDVRSRPCPG